MSPQWLPQNIQKRLLLYVLQQLALFSEIDLPNLEEVSLNNIHLKDVSIDPEKVGKLPGCNVRYGQVRDIAVTGGVMGGVNVEMSGLEIVVAPNLDVEDNISKSVSFALAQSTVDLANTIIKEEGEDLEKQLTKEDDDSEEEAANTSRRGSSSSSRPSALGGVMQRAVDMALARLQIRLTDIKVKLVSELTDLLVTVDEATIHTVNGTRAIKISGVTVITQKPDVNAGDSEGAQDRTPADNENDDEDDTDEGDSDYADPVLASSMVFTHEEASSIYMSATAQSLQNSLDAETENKRTERIILHLDTLDIEFEGLSDISNLCIGLGKLTIACCPLVPTVLSILNGVTRGLKLKSYRKKAANRAENHQFPQYADDDDEINDDDDNDDTSDSEQLFNKLHITTIIVSLTSAISNDGSFASPNNNVFLELNNLNVKQKNDSLIYGGVEQFLLKTSQRGKATTVFCFDNSLDNTQSDVPKADVRFELYSKTEETNITREITILLSKPAKIALDSYSLSNLIEFTKALDLLSEVYANFQNAYATCKSLDQPTQTKQTKQEGLIENKLIVQTAKIELEVKLDDASSMKIKIAPISFNAGHEELKCQKILFDYRIGAEVERVATIHNIHALTSNKQFQGHLNHVSHFSQAIVLRTSNNMQIQRVDVNILAKSLTLLAGQLNALFVDEPSLKRYDLFIPLVQGSTINTWRQPRRKRVAINSTNLCDFRVLIENMDITLAAISPKAGNLVNHYSQIEVYKLNGEILGHIKAAWLNRSAENVNERVVYDFKNSRVAPMVIFHSKHNIFEIKIRNMMIEFYAYWQSFFEKQPPKNDDANPIKQKESQKVDVRVQLHDCALGVSPNKLGCKALIALNKVHADLMVGSEKVYVKTTLRDLDLLLIDDVKHLKEQRSQAYFPVKQWFISEGYLKVGNINNLHIGITFNMNEQKLLKTHMNQYDKLSKVDIKINLDELNLETCGDSFYTLVQMVNDLKIPLILPDDEKFKFELDKSVNLFDEIDFNFFTAPQQQESFESIDSNQDGFIEIVDEYYSSKKDPSLASQLESLKIDKQLNEELHMEENYFNANKKRASNKVNPSTINLNLGRLNLYMFDGYDWKQTRKTIKGVVKKVEKESVEDDDAELDKDEVDIIEETLFESIHVTLPKGIDPSSLTKNINKQVNEEDSESSGYKDLKLKRSNRYKTLIELSNIDINIVIHTLRDPILEPINNEEFEVVNEVELVVDTVNVFDNLINSSWNKYLSYMSSHGNKEIGKNMIKLNLLTLRDPPNLNFNETVIKLALLPVRLFIDQDTNEFLGRFFKFKDARFKLPKLEEEMYIKRFEMEKLNFKIDYKPKKFNVIGLKNGEFNELLNLININGLTLSLSPIRLYGIKAIDSLFVRLFEHWLPNIQQTQLINLFSGVDMFKPIMHIGGSIKDMVVLPIRDYAENEYNNQVLYKSLNKNGVNFLKTTSFELLKLGYKLSNGTQNFLEHGEQMLGGQGSNVRRAKPKTAKPKGKEVQNEASSLMEKSIQLNKSIKVEDSIYDNKKLIREYEEDNEDFSEEDIDEEQEEKLISLYANQPKNFKQGVSRGYRAINKNLNLTKDEFLRIVERMDQADSFESSLKVLFKQSPLLLLRPMIGTTEMIAKTLMGLSNQIDSVEQIEAKDKYKPEV